MVLCISLDRGEETPWWNENWPMISDLQQWQQVVQPIWWCHHLVYLHTVSCHLKWRSATSDLSHLTLMNRGELLWQRMAYLIPAHLQRWPQPSCNVLGLSAAPATGQSNFGHVHLLCKVREEREWEEQGVGGGGSWCCREGKRGVVQVQVSGY